MTLFDIPPGWAIVIVGILGLVGVLVGARFSRLRALERENRQLWWGMRIVVDTLYRNGIEVPEGITELLRAKE